MTSFSSNIFAVTVFHKLPLVLEYKLAHRKEVLSSTFLVFSVQSHQPGYMWNEHLCDKNWNVLKMFTIGVVH